MGMGIEPFVDPGAIARWFCAYVATIHGPLSFGKHASFKTAANDLRRPVAGTAPGGYSGAVHLLPCRGRRRRTSFLAVNRSVRIYGRLTNQTRRRKWRIIRDKRRPDTTGRLIAPIGGFTLVGRLAKRPVRKRPSSYVSVRFSFYGTVRRWRRFCTPAIRPTSLLPKKKKKENRFKYT